MLSILVMSAILQGEAVELRADDLISLYRQNVGQAETLRVRWIRSDIPTETRFLHYEAQVSQLEQKLRSPSVSAQERQAVTGQIVGLRALIQEGAAGGRISYCQEFLQNRDNVQWRTSLSEKGAAFWKGSGQPKAIPQTEPVGADWTKALMNCQILSVGEDTRHEVREWTGHMQSGYYLGVITAAAESQMPESDFGIPPLSGNGPEWQKKRHVIDSFYAGQPGEYQVRGRYPVDGIDCVVADRIWKEKSPSGEIQTSAIRAFLDARRGALPIRLEFFKGDLTPDTGDLSPTTLNRRAVPEKIVYKIVLSEPAAGYFYPTSGITEVYTVKPRTGTGPWEFAAGSISEWKAESIVINEEFDGDCFALTFPDNTLLFDVRTGKRYVTGNPQDPLRQVLGQLPPSSHASHPAPINRWTILGMGSVSVFVGGLIFRYRRKFLV